MGSTNDWGGSAEESSLIDDWFAEGFEATEIEGQEIGRRLTPPVPMVAEAGL